MFNLLVSARDGAWDGAPYVLEQGRFLEFTTPDLIRRFSELGDKAKATLRSLPTLFAYETPVDKPARVGLLTNIQEQGKELRLTYEFDPHVEPITPARLADDLRWDLDTSDWELNRTHWAVKDRDLMRVLRAAGLTVARASPGSRGRKPARAKLAKRRGRGSAIEAPSVFVVHGHDNVAREEVARLLERLGLKAIILHEQANEGNTIIEKFEAHAGRAAFAVVLLTPDDIGYAKDHAVDARARARQNVLIELGFFLGALGRPKVCALRKGDVEIPTDYAGVVYVDMDEAGAWKRTLAKDMKAARLKVDLNKV